jgi:hypothetical protein
VGRGTRYALAGDGAMGFGTEDFQAQVEL